jgi:bifunctional UDP-N-acetylglucosamine pyrophosphorylase / glucosamine-1-phosphate N-acetyltransferase
MSKPSVAAVILAAGKGTRMKSTLHKVLHPIAGKPMIQHLLDQVAHFAPERQVVVVGAQREQLEAALPQVSIAVQEPQLGTGHAVLAARQALAGFSGHVLILYGDVPMVTYATMVRMIDALENDAVIAVLGFIPADAGAYGRIALNTDGSIAKMVEFKDATEAERALRLCNSGMMAVKSAYLFALLDAVTNDNAQGEYYLPDIVMLAAKAGHKSVIVEAPESEVAGVNSRGELARMEATWQQSRRRLAMADGVTLLDPATVYFSHDTQIANDVTIEPNVFFGPGVSVARGSVIHSFSHLEGCRVGEKAEIGPFARLRPGADLHTGVKIGNFVEIKKSVMESGAKANHLSYIGDAHVGAGANIGAGTITCNYDGFFKYKTEIGAGAFIGSNSSLVAPVKIGDGAIVGAGSVITKDISADALGVTRAEQKEFSNWAVKFRDKSLSKKKVK